MLPESVGCVLEKDRLQHDILVLGRVHLVLLNLPTLLLTEESTTKTLEVLLGTTISKVLLPDNASPGPAEVDDGRTGFDSSVGSRSN